MCPWLFLFFPRDAPGQPSSLDTTPPGELFPPEPADGDRCVGPFPTPQTQCHRIPRSSPCLSDRVAGVRPRPRGAPADGTAAPPPARWRRPADPGGDSPPPQGRPGAWARWSGRSGEEPETNRSKPLALPRPNCHPDPTVLHPKRFLQLPSWAAES